MYINLNTDFIQICTQKANLIDILFMAFLSIS